MNEDIRLDPIITVAVRPATDLAVSYGTSFPGDNATINYEETTTIYVADSQEGVTYKLYQGETPSDSPVAEVMGTGSEIALPTDDFGPLKGNTTFCILADKGDGVNAQLKNLVTVVVKPNPDVEIIASPSLINYGQTANIQVLLSQSTVKYYIQGYDLNTAVSGNGRTITLPTDPLENDGDFFVEAINLDDNADTKVVINNNSAITVQIRPDPDVEVTIPDLNEQDPGEGNADTTFKVARVVRNRELTIELPTPQEGITYQLWQDGAEKPDFVSVPAATTPYTIQTGSLDSAASFKILAVTPSENDTTLADTVRVELMEQVILESNLVQYGSPARVTVMATENAKTYTLYTGLPDPGGVEVQSSDGDESGDGTISLETGPLENVTTIYVTQKTTVGGGDETTIGEFSVGVTERVTAGSTWIPYGGTTTITIGSPQNGLTYQLRFDTDNDPGAARVDYSGDGIDPVVLVTDAITETTTFNITEGGEELRPTITVEVMPYVSLVQDTIPYNTTAVLEVCDPNEETDIDLYTLNNSDISINERNRTDDGIITLTTVPFTTEGEQNITVYYEGLPLEDGIVTLTVGNQATAASPVNYGSQAVVEVASTLESEKDTYELYDETPIKVDTENIYIGGEAGVTILTTVEGLTEAQTYHVEKTGTGAGTVGTEFTITVNPQVSALSPVSYNTPAVIRVAATEEGKRYALYVDDILLEGSEQDGNNGTLELTSPDPLLTETRFQVKDGDENPIGDPVEVTVTPRAYAEIGEVPYNTTAVNIIVAAAEAGVTYQAKEKISGTIYNQTGESLAEEDVIITIDSPFTGSIDFEVYQVADPSNIPINDVRIIVPHQLVESEIHIDYDGPAFIRLASSIFPDDNTDIDDISYEVTYELRLDADNTVVEDSEQIGNGDELIFKTPETAVSTWYNIYAVNPNPELENEEFRVQVIRETAPLAEVAISTEGAAMVSYGDTATITLQDPGANNTYEIIDNEGNIRTGGGLPTEGGNGEITYAATSLQKDTYYFGRTGETVPDDDNRVTVYMSRQTVMLGRLKFYGTYHYVGFGTTLLLQITDEQTIEMWVKQNATANGEQILYDKARTGEGTTVLNNGKTLSYYCENSVGASTDDVLADEWTHIAVVRTSSTLQWYINGVTNGEEGTFTGPTSKTTTVARLGAEKTADGLALQNFFNGLLAEVRLWSVARTADEINACRNRRLKAAEIEAAKTAGALVAYWRLDEEGTEAEDASGNGITGTINGAIWEGKEQVIAYGASATIIIDDSEQDMLYQIREEDTDIIYCDSIVGDGNDFEAITKILTKTITLQVYKGTSLNEKVGTPTTVTVLHQVFGKTVAQGEGYNLITVTIGASRTDIQYQLQLADGDTLLEVPQTGTGNENIFELYYEDTAQTITEDTVIKVVTDEGEVVGIA